GGRVVYGGGGIVPDIEVERELWKPIEINLERKSMFFDFAVKYVSEHPDLRPDFKVTEEMLAQFREFTKEKEFTYKSALQVSLEKMEETVNEQDGLDKFSAALEEMGSLVEDEKAADFDRSIDYIKRSIKREIITSIAGERGYYEYELLLADKAVRRAVEVLSEGDEYSRLLKEGQDKKAQL
ncbi:MAG: hypothetical protein V3T31_03000, partial [candidate division Zixibacteria bacterium]